MKQGWYAERKMGEAAQHSTLTGEYSGVDGMKEWIGHLLLVFGVLLLGFLMLVRPILEVGAAFDAGTITGTLVARSLVLVLLVRPTVRFWIGLFKHGERE